MEMVARMEAMGLGRGIWGWGWGGRGLVRGMILARLVGDWIFSRGSFLGGRGTFRGFAGINWVWRSGLGMESRGRERKRKNRDLGTWCSVV